MLPSREYHVDARIRLDIFFTVPVVIGDGVSGEIDIVANDSGAPPVSQKLGERAIAGLIRAKRRNQRVAVE